MSTLAIRNSLRSCDRKPYVIGHMNKSYSKLKSKLRLKFFNRVTHAVLNYFRIRHPHMVDLFGTVYIIIHMNGINTK